MRGLAAPLAIAAAALAGCVAVSSAPDDDAIALEQILTDPDSWGGNIVTVTGVVVFGEIQSRLYLDAATAKEGWTYDRDSLRIRMSELREPFPRSYGGKSVRVTGTVNNSCVQAERAFDAAQVADRIVMISGFCHTSVGPHLVDATVRLVR